MASTEIDFQPAKPQKKSLAGSWANCKKFCYNSQDGTFCGRTGSSWAKIGLFYFVYYVLLAGFCAMMAAIFFTTLSDKEPKQQGMDSLIKGNPGMAFIPMPNPETTLIKFKQGEKKSYASYIKAISAFLKPYTDPEEVRKRDSHTQDCSTTRDTDSDLPCKFDVSTLGNWCTVENDYGFYDGQPCVLMKMNRVWAWKPNPYTRMESNLTDAPYELFIDPSVPGIPVTCEGLTLADLLSIKNITMFPPAGFPATLFPYLKQPGYMSPLIWFRFNHLERNTYIKVWCRAWAKNLENNQHRDRNGGLRLSFHVSSADS